LRRYNVVPCVVLAAPVLRMVFGSTCFDFENYAMLMGVMNAILVERCRLTP
jgi:hypothetical protein